MESKTIKEPHPKICNCFGFYATARSRLATLRRRQTKRRQQRRRKQSRKWLTKSFEDCTETDMSSVVNRSASIKQRMKKFGRRLTVDCGNKKRGRHALLKIVYRPLT